MRSRQSNNLYHKSTFNRDQEKTEAEKQLIKKKQWEIKYPIRKTKVVKDCLYVLVMSRTKWLSVRLRTKWFWV